jgi:hypothetical protein
MQSITTIGLDLAKSIFQVHGVDAAGQVVMRRQLKRRYVLKFFEKLPPCLVGIEACASFTLARDAAGQQATSQLGSLLDRQSEIALVTSAYQICESSAAKYGCVALCKTA